MYKKFKLVKVDSKYCDYLRKYDARVAYNAGIKGLRPFIGVLFVINKCEYFVPLSSPKPKHQKIRNTIDLIKINNGIYGVVNFNNMIPVTNRNYFEFNLDKKTKNKIEDYRIELLKNQLRWLTANKKEVITKSRLLYNLYKKGKLPNNVKERCCNFPLLEKKCEEFNSIHNLNI